MGNIKRWLDKARRSSHEERGLKFPLVFGLFECFQSLLA